MFMTGSKVFQFQKADNEVDGKHSEKSKHKLCGFFYHAFFQFPKLSPAVHLQLQYVLNLTKRSQHD